MKIVHFIPALARGGAERVVTDLANLAAQRGHRVAILCAVPTPTEEYPGPLRPEVEVRHVSSSGQSRRRAYLHMPLWLARNRSWLLSQDVIHCHLTAGSVFATQVQVLRRAKSEAGPAVVETYHAVGMHISPLQRAFHSALLGSRDAIAFMAEDPYWTEFRQARPNGLFKTIPNGIVPLPAISPPAVERFRQERTGIPEGAVVVGAVGRLVPARRPDLILETFIRLVRIGKQPLHLLLAGEGAERARLEARAQAAGLADRVHFPGLILDRAEALGLIDLFLTINVGSTSGVAALEASFSGVPVIALQLVAGYEGSRDWIPSFGHPEELANQAAQLIEDGAALRQLAGGQRSFAEVHFSAEQMASAYQELYEAALAKRRVSGRLSA